MGLMESQIRRDFTEYKNHKKRIVDEDLPLTGVNIRKITRPIQRGLLFGQRMINGQKVNVIGNKDYVIPEGRPVIFVVSHIGKYDFEIVNELIKEQFYVLASDYYNMHGNFNEFMMNWFGVYFVDELDKEDKLYTGKIVKKTLEQGLNAMILAEGTWNLSPNEIIMDTHYGSVDIAMSKNALILPISVEQYDKDFVVDFGKLFDPNKVASEISFEMGYYKSYDNLNDNSEEEIELKNLLKDFTNTMMRDMLATLKMEIWSTLQVEKRAEIDENYWHEFIEKRKKEWPGYSMNEQLINTVHTKEKTLHNDVLNDLVDISLANPGALSASDLRYYLSDKEREVLIYESLDRLREEIEKNPIEPVEKRLEKFKQLKRK